MAKNPVRNDRWIESRPGYAHGLPEFLPDGKSQTKLLSKGAGKTALREKKRNRTLNSADRYLLKHLFDLYETNPFKRGDLDAGRVGRLLGREIHFASDHPDLLSPETLLRIQTPPSSRAEVRISPPSKPPRQYRYGDKPTWELVLEAVQELGQPVSASDVSRHMEAKILGFARGNVGPDLSVLSVNCPSRGHHSPNSSPRRTDSGSKYDRLFKSGRGQNARFVIYQPELHGVWELADLGRGILSPQFVQTIDAHELAEARISSEGEDLFGDDTRRRSLAAIVQREGQPAFRRELLSTYRNTCVISGCTIADLLEAAHIVPYQGMQSNSAANGLLLRADLHKLFDLHMLSIDPQTMTVRLSPALLESEYACFDGVRIRPPHHPDWRPRPAALHHHRDRCSWLNADPHGCPLTD